MSKRELNEKIIKWYQDYLDINCNDEGELACDANLMTYGEIKEAVINYEL